MRDRYDRHVVVVVSPMMLSTLPTESAARLCVDDRLHWPTLSSVRYRPTGYSPLLFEPTKAATVGQLQQQSCFAMSTVGMSNVPCQMYLSKYLITDYQSFG